MTQDRPFMHHRITQLEAVLQRAHADPTTLRALAHELSLRKTDRAARLRVEVAKALKVVPPVATPPKVSEAASTGVASQPGSGPASRTAAAPARRAAPTPDPRPGTADRSLPADAPASILGAWTALEVLSPRTFRRPEDLAGEDRWAVARLTDAALPWEAGERSRMNYQLYHQVYLGAIPIDRATERLTATPRSGTRPAVFERRQEGAVPAIGRQPPGDPVLGRQEPGQSHGAQDVDSATGRLGTG